MTIKETLVAARKLIENPENWCKGFTFRKSNNEPTSDVKEAAKYCAIGAIHGSLALQGIITTGEDRDNWNKFEDSFSVLQRALLHLRIEDIHVSNFNDNATHSDVLRLFDLAIEKAE